MSPQPGQKIGRYELLEVLGRGATGVVHRAWDPQFRRHVAIKFIRPAYIENLEYVTRFRREGRALAKLNHEHICKIYDGDDSTYLVMELVKGTPLAGRLPPRRASEYAAQILSALDHAHQEKLLHRDLSPANIFITPKGIKLLDFGLTKSIAPQTTEGLTASMTVSEEGQLRGTLPYMSPEQVLGQEVDERSDLFQFGCVFYEMLTGTRAFQGDTGAARMAAILERNVDLTDLDPRVAAVIRSCLEKKPENRFRNTSEAARALAIACTPEPPTLPAPSSWIKRNLYWLIGTIISAVIGLGSGWAFSPRSRVETPPIVRFQLEPPAGIAASVDAGRLSVSPDGRTVAYFGPEGTEKGIWLRPLDGSNQTFLKGTDHATQLFWSPNSRSIGFIALGQLQTVNVVSKGVSSLCNVPLSTGGVAWSSDGRIVFGTAKGLFQLPESGGIPKLLTSVDEKNGEVGHFFPDGVPTLVEG